MEPKQRGEEEEKQDFCHALVIDNSDFSRQQIVNTLVELNIKIVGELTSSNTDNIAELISETNANIIILDVVVPHFNGIELIGRFSGHLDEKYFIIISSFYQKTIIVEAIKSGVTDFLQKPLNKNLLIQSVLKIQHRIESKKSGQKLYD